MKVKKKFKKVIETKIFKGEDEVYHYVYQITNLINGKIYVGKHSTIDLEDGYISSGTALNNSIKKYGIEKFSIRILMFFNTAKDALEYEKEIVNEDFVLRKDTYNLITGGFGGEGGCRSEAYKDNLRKLKKDKTWEEIFGEEKAKELKEKKSKYMTENNPMSNPEILEKRSGKNHHYYGEKRTQEVKRKISKDRIENKDFSGENNSFYGEKHSEETKRKMKKSWQERRKRIEEGSEPKAKCLTLIQVADIKYILQKNGYNIDTIDLIMKKYKIRKKTVGRIYYGKIFKKISPCEMKNVDYDLF